MELLQITVLEVVLVYQSTTSGNIINMFNNYTKTKSHKQGTLNAQSYVLEQRKDSPVLDNSAEPHTITNGN